nr:hypothetical protein [Tanacetum cinerariifolium]
MSDSEDSTIMYTTISSPYEGRSRDVSPGVDGPPVMPKDPYVYVLAAFQALPPPDYVHGPEEPEQAPPSPPLLVAASPTAESPGYIPESDPDEDPEEDDDEDPEEDLTDYLTDHDDEEEEEDPSGDDADEEQDEDDDDVEEEHPTSADSIPPPPALRVTARISFRPQPSTLSFTKEDAERFLAMPIPPPLPLTLLSSPLPQIPSPPLPTSPLILPIQLPAVSPPLQLLSSDRRADRPKVTLPPQKRLSIVHFSGYEAGESSVAAAARPIEETPDVAEEEALTTLERVNTRVTELAAVQEQNTQDIYGVMEDTQGRQTKIFQRVKALVDDSQYHYETGRLGHLATALGEIRALQAREQAHAASRRYRSFVLKMAPKKAAPKRTTRLNPGATSNPYQAPSTTTTTVTNAQLQAMIDQGVNAALAARALTWWNSYVRIVGNDAAYVMTWIELKKKMTDKYCPRNEMKKIETEFWNLKVQEESDRIERYIGGLPDSIHGSVAASKPKTMQEATEMETGLMDKKILTYAKRQAANKRKTCSKHFLKMITSLSKCLLESLCETRDFIFEVGGFRGREELVDEFVNEIIPS